MSAPPSAPPSGRARDLRLAAAALWGFVRSGAFLSSRAEWRRMIMSARWLAVGRLGIKEVVLPFEGMRLIGRTGDHFVACRVYMDGHFGRNEFQKALALAREAGFFNGAPPVFVDVGANIGTHTLYAIKTGLFSRVLSVEPSTENYGYLCRNLSINGFPTTDAFRAAFSSTPGSGRLALSGLNFGDHRVVRGATEALLRARPATPSLRGIGDWASSSSFSPAPCARTLHCAVDERRGPRRRRNDDRDDTAVATAARGGTVFLPPGKWRIGTPDVAVAHCAGGKHDGAVCKGDADCGPATSAETNDGYCGFLITHGRPVRFLGAGSPATEILQTGQNGIHAIVVGPGSDGSAIEWLSLANFPQREGSNCGAVWLSQRPYMRNVSVVGFGRHGVSNR